MARVLIVCTANVCRSPMAAGLLQKHLLLVGANVKVHSAGTQSVELPVDPQAVRAAREFGVDLRAHRPRQFDAAMLATDGADLIVTMTRQHLRDVVFADPLVWPRTFTLRELVRRSLQTPTSAATRGLRDWVGALGDTRVRGNVLNDDPNDDVIDPYGQSMRKVRSVAAELDHLTGQLCARAPWPHRSTDPG